MHVSVSPQLILQLWLSAASPSSQAHPHAPVHVGALRPEAC